MIDQRGTLARFLAASAAFAAAIAVAGPPAPAAAAVPSAATQVAAAAFPADSFRLENPSQQARCATPKQPSYNGALTLKTCDDVAQYFFSFDWAAGETELLPLYGEAGDGYPKCLAANTSNQVYTETCTDTSNEFWQLVGKTVKNKLTGKCLSGNSAGAVYTETCDGAVNRNWAFPTSVLL